MIITATDIRKTLATCKFNPKTSPSMKVVCDTATSDYIAVRLIELANEANRAGYKNELEELFRQIIKLATIGILKVSNE